MKLSTPQTRVSPALLAGGSVTGGREQVQGRASRLYEFWMLTILGRPSCSASWQKRMTPQLVSLLTPTHRTCPRGMQGFRHHTM